MTAAAWGRSDRLVAGGRQERTFGVAWTTADRWAERYRLEGAAGMADRSSRPVRQPGEFAAKETIQSEVIMLTSRDDRRSIMEPVS